MRPRPLPRPSSVADLLIGQVALNMPHIEERPDRAPMIASLAGVLDLRCVPRLVTCANDTLGLPPWPRCLAANEVSRPSAGVRAERKAEL